MKTNHYKRVPASVRLILTLLLLCVLRPAVASLLFEQHPVIEVELSGQIQAMVKNKDVREERPFVLRSSDYMLDVGVRVRGKSRIRICEFPPLRLNFQNGQGEPSDFDGQGKLKLVTHCFNNDMGESNLLKEYIAYRIFNLLSEVSYRTRLLKVHYLDSDGQLDEDAQLRYGFVIESAKQLAKRVGGVRLGLDGVYLSRFNREHAALVYVFQYMIGNTDWSFVTAEGDAECCHNGDLLEIGGDLYYVPYDFDLAGIVNARYAKPDPSLKIRSVKTRRYRGFCTDSETLRGAIRRVKSSQTDIYKLVRETPGLTRKTSEKVLDYLAKFFQQAENEEKLLQSFEKRCID